MNCKHIYKLFSEYFDKELKKDQIELLESHLESCSKCRDFYLEYSKTMDNLKKWQDIDPDKEYISKIWRKIESKSSKKSAWILRDQFLKKSYLVSAVIILFITLSIPVRNYYIGKNLEKILEEQDVVILEILQNYEFAQSINVIENIDYLEEL